MYLLFKKTYLPVWYILWISAYLAYIYIYITQQTQSNSDHFKLIQSRLCKLSDLVKENVYRQR